MLKFLSLSTALLLIAGPVLAAPDDQPAPAEKPGRTVNTTPSITRGLMRYDNDKDGAVDRTEWKAAQDARFKRLDTNNDGALIRDELFARTPAVGNSVLPTNRQAQRQSSYFQLLDADKDGAVSLAEFMAQADRNFARCDLDKNDRIDTAECRQALQRTTADQARQTR